MFRNHFPEEINEEIDKGKIEITEVTPIGIVTKSSTGSLYHEREVMKKVEKVEGTYGEIDPKTFRHLWKDLFVLPAVGGKMWNFMRNHENGFSPNGSQWTWQSW